MVAPINSNLALFAILLVLLNLTVKIFSPSQAAAAAAAATFKIISDQHRNRDTTVSSSLDLTPQQTTQFDDDDDEQSQTRDAGNTYTLVPRDTGIERAPTPRFHWPTSETGVQPANASALSKLLNRDTRLRYKVQAHRTLNSSQPADKCQKNERRENELDIWRMKNKKRGLLEPILLTSDVKVRSDLVLVRDQQQAATPTSYDDLLSSLPIKTLSQRVKVVFPSHVTNRDEQGRDEKLSILRGEQPGSSKQQLEEQIRSSLSGVGGGGGNEDESEEMQPGGNNNDLEIDGPGQSEELTRAADTRKPVRLTVKRKYGLSFKKVPADLPQQLRSAPATTSGIRVTVGNGTWPLVVNSRGLITAAKRPNTSGTVTAIATNTSRLYNPAQLFASSQTSQTLNPIETMIVHGPSSPGVKKRPTASLILRQPAAYEAVKLAPTQTDSSYSLSPMTSTTNSNSDRTLQSTTSSHLLEGGFNRTTSGTSTTSTTLASGNFHHNPPYQQHHLDHSSTTASLIAATPPPTRTPTRPNNRFQSSGANQHQYQPPARIGGAHTGARNQTGGNAHKRPSMSPYEPGTADLLSEPANTLQIHQRPQNIANNSAHTNLSHLQQTLATTSLKPTKIRIKLFHSLFGGAKPHKSISSLANQTSGSSSSLASHSSGSPAPLLSSTVANNVAALLAKKLTSLVRPPSMPLSISHHHHHHLPLNSLFGFRVGPQTTTNSLGQSFSSSKIKNPFAAAASQASSPLNLGINRRTTGVGSLLVSGLIYGLTVLPALMALTGINPLSSDSSGPVQSVSAVANRQQNGEKRSKHAKSARHRPGRDTGQHSILGDSSAANSDAFAYLFPVLSSPAAAAAAASLQGADASQPALGSLSLASTVEPMRVSAENAAQSSALKSLYAPPPTVLESFGAANDFTSLLEDQPTSEIEWPTTGAYKMPAADEAHNHPHRWQPQHQRLGQPGSSWPPSSSTSEGNNQPPARGSFVRRNRDLPNERGQHWPATSDGHGGDTSRARQPGELPSVLFDDRSATTVSGIQPQQASRQVSQIASPPSPANGAQQSWSVGMAAPNGGTHHDSSRQVTQSDRFRQQVSYLIDAQQQQERQQRQLAQLAANVDGDLAILGPYRPPPPLSSMHAAVDFGGLRQRRTAIARIPPSPSPPSSPTGQLMNLTTNERPWQGDSWTSLADKSHHPNDKSMGIQTIAQGRPVELHHSSHRATAPKWASESDWRVVGLPSPSRSPSKLPSSSSRQGDRLLHRSQTERLAASELGAKKKSNKNKKSAKRKRLSDSRPNASVKSQPLANATTTSRAPAEKDYAESELIMAHSMAMGSRVLNERLTSHHQ